MNGNKQIAAMLIVAAVGMYLAVRKVSNELQMTEEYHAQAMALDRIANVLEGHR